MCPTGEGERDSDANAVALDSPGGGLVAVDDVGGLVDDPIASVIDIVGRGGRGGGAGQARVARWVGVQAP